MERRIDELGRVLIPIGMRRRLGIGEKDKVYMGVVDEVVVVTKKEEADLIERTTDKLGRIVIPMEWRRVLSIADGAVLDCVLDGDVVKLSRSKVCCVMCGGSENVKDVKMIRLCQECVEEIKVGNFWEAV